MSFVRNFRFAHEVYCAKVWWILLIGYWAQMRTRNFVSVTVASRGYTTGHAHGMPVVDYSSSFVYRESIIFSIQYSVFSGVRATTPGPSEPPCHPVPCQESAQDQETGPATTQRGFHLDLRDSPELRKKRDVILGATNGNIIKQ